MPVRWPRAARSRGATDWCFECLSLSTGETATLPWKRIGHGPQKHSSALRMMKAIQYSAYRSDFSPCGQTATSGSNFRCHDVSIWQRTEAASPYSDRSTQHGAVCTNLAGVHVARWLSSNLANVVPGIVVSMVDTGYAAIRPIVAVATSSTMLDRRVAWNTSSGRLPRLPRGVRGVAHSTDD